MTTPAPPHIPRPSSDLPPFASPFKKSTSSSASQPSSTRFTNDCHPARHCAVTRSPDQSSTPHRNGRERTTPPTGRLGAQKNTQPCRSATSRSKSTRTSSRMRHSDFSWVAHFQQASLCRFEDLPNGEVEVSVCDPNNPSRRIFLVTRPPHRTRTDSQDALHHRLHGWAASERCAGEKSEVQKMQRVKARGRRSTHTGESSGDVRNEKKKNKAGSSVGQELELQEREREHTGKLLATD